MFNSEHNGNFVLNMAKRLFSHPVKCGGGIDFFFYFHNSYCIFQPILGDPGKHGSWFFTIGYNRLFLLKKSLKTALLFKKKNHTHRQKTPRHLRYLFWTSRLLW